MQQKGAIQIIEWEDLDKRKFYSLGVFMTLTTRATVYPASLIRTRLQVQKGKSLYSGTFDALCKILRTEGVRGLYRGFMVNTLTLIAGQGYITTYELVRKYVNQYSPSNTVKSVVAGGMASLVAQTITVPIDIVSQHLMMQGQGEHLTRFKAKPKVGLATRKHKLSFGQTRDITVQIFAADGFRGFYRGYVASLLTYIPNSALWWPFYHFYAGRSRFKHHVKYSVCKIKTKPYKRVRRMSSVRRKLLMKIAASTVGSGKPVDMNRFGLTLFTLYLLCSQSSYPY